MYRTTVDVLAVQDKLTLCWGDGVPVPVADSATGAFVALLTNVMVPDAVPLVVGVNVSEQEAV